MVRNVQTYVAVKHAYLTPCSSTAASMLPSNPATSCPAAILTLASTTAAWKCSIKALRAVRAAAYGASGMLSHGQAGRPLIQVW